MIKTTTFFTLIASLFLLVACSSADHQPRTADHQPVDLRCHGMRNPLATGPTPELSWRLHASGDERGLYQTAWQILVASTPELLAKERGDLWDSGKMPAQRSPKIRYAGKPLEAGQVCHWKVRVWNQQDQASAWSHPAKWEVAPSSPVDWRGAQWIDDGKDNPERDEDFYKNDPAPLLRREFEIAQPIVRARLHLAALGLGYASLNGQRLEDQVFDPPWTNFDQRILYRTHDVTELLLQGGNCLGLELGNGWYNPLPLRMWGRRNLREALPVGRPRAIACLVIEHPDGSETVVTTGPDWKTAEGPTLRNSIYLGEIRDARKALPGWNTVGYEPGAWRPVRVRDEPLEPLQALILPPVRLKEAFTATEVSSPQAGLYIVDFGRNFTGLPEIDLDVPAGTRITFRFGEILHPDGTLNPLTSVCGQIKRSIELEDGSLESIGGPGAPEIAWQEDVYIARGGGERYRPDFTFHAFRYMEITGLNEAPAVESMRGYPLRSDLKSLGRFASSNRLLNQIQKTCLNTFLANVVTVQSDCPHRERFAYGGDIVATSEAFLMNFDMAGFYAKTVLDWADAALPDGRLTDTAPFVGVDYCGVGWAMVHPLLLEQLHQYYGADDLIREQLPVALRWLDAEAARREADLVVHGLGDHEALTENEWGPKLTTPMFVDAARRIARLANLLGQTEAAARAEAYAEASESAWEKTFLDPATGKIAEGTQSTQTFALAYTEAEPATGERIFQQLIRVLTAPKDGPRLSTGIYGTRILLEELSKRGRSDLAYALATRESFPSWGWMLKNGATTLWESWEQSNDSHSHNHPMFGSISAWFYRWLGGIQPADDAVGFDLIHLRPQVVPDLEWVQTSYESIRGTIVSNWSQTKEANEHEFIIPPNVSATLELPLPAGHNITESGQAIDQAKGIQILPQLRPDTIRLNLGSGHYHFRVLRP